jgi:type VI protein secretion system component VasK
VEWAYDQMRREHADEKEWEEFLAGQGMSPQSLRAELRSQHTVAALLEQELRRASGGEVDEELIQGKQAEIQEALLARLRAKARIELLL